MAHCAAQDATAQDPQLVSSMLTAIQDFVRDSFSGAERHDLDAVRFGDLRLWSEQGPSATLVAVIRGNPPESLHGTFRTTLSEIHDRHHVALEAFNGDGSDFDGLEEQLAQCAGLAQSAPESAVVRHWGLLVLLVIAGLSALLATWAWRSWRAERLWEGYLSRLRAEPGIVVMEQGERNSRWLVSGLRDPLAADPLQILRQSKIDPARVDSRWQPFQALDPQFILQRLQAVLDPPRSVTLAVDGDRIVVGGSAPVTWVRRARASTSALAISPFWVDLTQVRELDDAAFSALRDAIQSKEIRFDVNESTPAQGQDQILDDVAQELQQLVARSATLHVPVRLMLTGHSDVTGKGTANLSISLARAETVRALLRKRGVDPDLLAVRAAGALEPLAEGESESARSVDRRVSFSVEFE
jgi:OOP family OmpA-OmpF porin